MQAKKWMKPLFCIKEGMEYLRVGIIARPHGVCGEVRITPLTTDVERFRALRDAYLERNGNYEPIVISDVRIQPDVVLASLSCANDRDEAEALKNHYICVDREHAVKLPEGQYFIVDLVGCRVFDTAGKDYGVLTDVYETGANDVYVIQGERKLQIPALKKLLAAVDPAQKRIVLDHGVLEEVGLFED